MSRFAVYAHTPDGGLAFVGNVQGQTARRAARSAKMLRPNHPDPIVAIALPSARTRVRFRACVTTLFPDQDPTP